MRHLQGLLPYALASVAVVVASAIALGSTIRGPFSGPTGPTAGVEPTPLGSRATLSESGRMAYWRTAQSGQLELWVSDLDGGRRWTIATAGSGSDIALTRWAPDGNALAYVISGQTLAISRLDGSSAYLDIPGELRTQRWRLVSFEWSPDATRVAATLRAANGLSNVSDVYLVNARPAAIWERLTLLGDAFAGKWISPTQLFIEEASGAVLTLDLSSKALRPITGMPVTSPQIGRDGRVYFVGGQFVVSDVAAQPVGNGWIWSATIDGDDLRREIRDGHDNLRLFGMLADGRAVVGVPGGVYVAADGYIPLAFQSGTVRRVIVSPDGKRMFGITDQRILLIDPTKVPRSVLAGGLPPAEAASVLLSSVRDADVWFPFKPAALARSGRVAPETPKAKLAFVLGRGLYQMEADGAVRALATEQVGAIAGAPRWSPLGDRVAVPVGLPGNATAGIVIVAGPSTFSRWEVAARFPQGLSWTADGKAFGIWLALPQRNAVLVTQVYDADTGRAREEIAGRATFTANGTIVLSDGDLEPSQTLRTRQRVDLVTSTGTRAITDAGKLAVAPLLKDLPDAALPARIDQLLPSADGQYLAVWLTRVRPNVVTSTVVVVVRAADGAPVWQMAVPQQQSPLTEIAWSPSGALLAWTATVGPGNPPARRAIVIDPVAGGRTLVSIDGRFAGWAPDSSARAGATNAPANVPWIYVARDDGLFAYPSTGGDPVRIGPIGVPVAATKP
jgi:hypothetical protein